MLTLFHLRAILNFTTLISHHENSLAEGYPTKLRVVTPTYVRWDNDSSTFDTNYTIAHNDSAPYTYNETVEVQFNETGNSELIFIFPRGITFPDIVWLNFSLKVDPDALRLPGAGDEQTAIGIHATCVQSSHEDFPAAGEEERYCGDFISEELETTAPGTCTIVIL